MFIYENEEVTKDNFPKPKTDDPEKGFVGFVYMMGAIINGEKKFYIGKKTVYSPRKKKLGKRELDARKSKSERDWKWVTHFEKFEDYFSSSDTLKKAHEEGVEIKRVILHICYSKAELTYQEARHLFKSGAIEKPEFLNDSILGKFYRSTLHPETIKNDK